MMRHFSVDSSPAGDILLDDTSSINVELTKEDARKLNERLNSQYAYGSTNVYVTDYSHMHIKAHKNGTIFSSTLNLSNCVIGAGLLGIPSAIRNSGYLVAMALFMIASCIALYTMHLSMCVALCVNYASYDTLCSVTVPKLKKVADTMVCFGCFGICVAYFVVIGDSMDLAMEYFLQDTDQKLTIFSYQTYGLWINRYFWMILYLCFFIAPTISLKQMDSLKYTSFFALFVFVALMILILLYLALDAFPACDNQILETDACNYGISALPSNWIQCFKTSPIFIFAYECHANIWPIRNEMKVANRSRLNKVSLNTVLLCTTIYALVGFAAYLTYGESVKGNILNNYPQTQLLGIIRVGLSFAITFSYPLVSYMERECLSTLLFDKAPSELNGFTYYGITYIMALMSVICAIVLDDLEIVLSLIGSIGGTSMVLIFPALFYYYLDDHPLLKRSTYHSFKRQSCIPLCIAGIMIGVFGIVLQFI